MEIQIKNETIDLDKVSQLYAAAIIRYADGTVTPISLEWFDDLANEDVELLNFAICIHYREEENRPLLFTYETRENLDEAIDKLATQLKGS